MSNDTKSAKKTLIELAELNYFMTIRPRKGEKPGTTISNLPEETRKCLSRLKSEDIADIRWPL